MLLAAVEGASVRELEKMAAMSKKAPKKEKKEQSKPTFYNEVELSLKETMRRKVQVKPTAKGKGTITIEFFSDKELSEFAKKLAGE